MTGEPGDDAVVAKQEGDETEGPGTLLTAIARRGTVILFCLGLVFRMLSRNDYPFFTGEMGFQWFVSLILITAFLFFLCSFPGRTCRVPYNWTVILAVLFFGWVGFSSVFATYSFAAWMAVGIWSGHLAAFILVLLMWENDRGLLIYPLATVCAAAVFQMCLGVYQYLVLYPELANRVRESPSVLLQQVPSDMVRILEQRIHEQQPSGTLLNANSFAALCSVGGLFLVGAIIWRMLASGDGNKKSTSVRGLTIAAVFLSGLVLFLIYSASSKGAFVALVGATVVTVFLAVYPGSSARIRWGTCAGTALVVVVLTWIAVVGNDVTEQFPSLKYRGWYASAGGEMVKDYPVTGVGLYNYQYFYTRYKPECARETRRAHNDYLDVTAETGVPGGVLFLLFWLALLYRLFPGTGRKKREIPAPGAWSGNRTLQGVKYVLAGAIIAGLSGMQLVGTNSGPIYLEGHGLLFMIGVPLLIVLSFSGAVFVLRPVLRDAPGTTGWPLLLALPLFFYVIHAVVDFDLYVPAVATPIWMIAALASRAGTGSGQRIFHGQVGRNSGMIIMLILFVVLSPLLLQGSDFMRSANRLKELRRSGNMSPGKKYEEYRNILDRRPDDVRLRVRMSTFYHSSFCRRVPDLVDRNENKIRAGRKALNRFQTCLNLLNGARTRMPANWAVYERMYHQIREHHELRKQLPTPAGEPLIRTSTDLHSEEAQRSVIQKAHNWYPAHPRVRFYFGKELWEAGEKVRATRMFRRAYSIHNCQTLNHLKLTDEQLNFVRSRLGSNTSD